MTQDQIREILNNFNNLKWDQENLNNFVGHVKALNIETLDEDLKQKVISFLNNMKNDANILQQKPIINNDQNQNNLINSLEGINIVDGVNIIENNHQTNPSSNEQNLGINSQHNPVDQNQNNYINPGNVSQGNEIKPLQPVNVDNNENKDIKTKSKKKNNPILIIILILILVIAIVGGLVYADIIKLPNFLKTNEPKKIEEKKKTVKENLICKLVENDYDYNVEIITDATVTFNEKDLAQTLTYEVTYQYFSFEDYQREINNIDETTILESSEENLTIKTQTIINLDKNVNIPTDYDGIKNYLIDLGHNCNNEDDNDSNDEVIDENIDEPSQEQYSIDERIDFSNNLFSYQQLYFEKQEENPDLLAGRVENVKNITEEGQILNIYLNLYDQDYNLIGEFKLNNEAEVTETSMFYIARAEAKTMNFVINNDNLIDDKTIHDIQYFSIENIN